MFIKNVVYYLNYEKDKYSKGRDSWELLIAADGGDKWLVRTWKNEPTEEEVQEILNLISTSFYFYHMHMKMPKCDFTFTKWK